VHYLQKPPEHPGRSGGLRFIEPPLFFQRPVKQRSPFVPEIVIFALFCRFWGSFCSEYGFRDVFKGRFVTIFCRL